MNKNKNYLTDLMQKIILEKKKDIQKLTAHLCSLNPNNLLKKGYSIVFSEKDDSIILSVEQLSLNENIKVQLSDGTLNTEIKKINIVKNLTNSEIFMSFEKSFERLEEILQTMNQEKISLDESLKLFEEADSLINKCNSELQTAEKKVEILIKNREKELVLDKDNKPKMEEFNVASTHTLNDETT